MARRSLHLLSTLTVCLLALSAGWAASPVVLGPRAPREQRILDLSGQRADVIADEIIALLNKRAAIELRGSAQITVGEIVIWAQRLQVDQSDGRNWVVRGNGGIRVVNNSPAAGGRQATGDEIYFDVTSRTGYVQNALFSQPLPLRAKPRDLLDPEERPNTVSVSARRAALTQPYHEPKPGQIGPGRWVDLDEPTIWIPQGKVPQFRFKAAKAQMMLCDPGCLVDNVDIIKLRDVRLQLNGHTVFRLPALHLGQGSGLFLPYLGFNDTWGLFAQQSLSSRLAENVHLKLTPRIGTTNGLTGQAAVAWSTPVGELALSTSFRERTMLPVSREVVQYSRWPEASWTLPDQQVPLVGGKLTTSAAVGLIREHGTGTFWRSRYDLGWSKSLSDTPTFAASMRAKAHWSWGDAGYMYGWLGGGATVEKSFANRFWLRLGADSLWVSGTTPFRFERIEAPILLSAEARWRVARHWVVQDALGYDVERGKLTDHRSSLLYRDRLLEYGLTVRSEPTFEVQLSAGVVGFNF